jgi:perosamine synthetase
MIPHSRPSLNESDFTEVLRVLRSGQLAQGQEVRKFEDAVASTIGMRAGAAVSSGTAALHLTLIAMGIGRGDEVVIPSYVCSALLNALNQTGAQAVLADIDPDTYNIDPADVRKRVTRRTKAVIVPHMFGLAADMDEILSFDIPVIEDCALSIGSRYKSRPTGSMGVVSIFSFYATKVLTTGEGGMVLSNNVPLIEAIRDLNHYDDREDYRVRYNYKMTDFQAALGLSQLNRLTSFIEKRKRIASIYTQTLARIGRRTPSVPADRDHIFYRYILPEVPPDFGEEMKRRGIECRKPVFRPLHRYLGLSGYPNTDAVWDRAVSIPVYPLLADEEIGCIAAALKSVLG